MAKDTAKFYPRELLTTLSGLPVSNNEQIINIVFAYYAKTFLLEELSELLAQACKLAKELQHNSGSVYETGAGTTISGHLETYLSDIIIDISRFIKDDAKMLAGRRSLKKILGQHLLYAGSPGNFRTYPSMPNKKIAYYNSLDYVALALIYIRTYADVTRPQLILQTKNIMLACASLISLKTYIINFPLAKLILSLSPLYDEVPSHGINVRDLKDRAIFNGALTDSKTDSRFVAFAGPVYLWLKEKDKINKPRLLCTEVIKDQGFAVLLSDRQAEQFRIFSEQQISDSKTPYAPGTAPAITLSTPSS